ncbi:coenzyme F420 hydrogenase [Spiribacter vilamensis]|nr:coenzyme F420 hydrogenase [Spiribacter vilamensis]
MTDVPDAGLRPTPVDPEARTLPEGDGAAVCPGGELGLDASDFGTDTIADLRAGWGPVRQLWEGAAADNELRYSGSSGGAASALALYALEAEQYEGVLHIAAREDIPYLNQTVISRSRAELLARTGSRYAPASPCDGLAAIEEGEGPFVFIGKPCDVAATRKARRLRPELDRNLGLTIAFFCAGVPSTRGTLEMLEKMGVSDPSTLRSLRYRGNGWPGKATAVYSDEGDGTTSAQLSYEESWGSVLTRHVQWRCRLCADHTGEFADIAVGDPWYRPVEPGEAGSSLVLARTERGRDFVLGAMTAGYLIAKPAAPDVLPRSQPNLLSVRGAVWGRIMTLRLIGAYSPSFRGLKTFRFWCSQLSPKAKLMSVVGTIKRCLKRRMHPAFHRSR